jgi:hypothetical protein
VKNIEVGFGYSIEDVADNTVIINTNDSANYNNITNSNDVKALTLTWFNKDENNKYLGFTDGVFGTLDEAKDPDAAVYYIQWEHY